MIRTLVVRSGALGDFVLTLPLIARALDDGAVDVVCPARFACLLPDGAARLADEGWLWRGGPPPRAWDRVVVFSASAAEASRACGLPTIARAARPAPGLHAASHALAAIVPGAERARPPRPVVRATPDPREPGHPVVLAPGSGGVHKRWPLERWRAVAGALARAGVPVRWVRGPDEVEEGGWPSDAVSPDLPGLCALAAAAGAWAGPDAGPSHVAAAVGAPAFIVFGPTDPAEWAPPAATVLPWDVEPLALATILARARGVRGQP